MLASFFSRNRRTEDDHIVKAVVTQTSALVNDLQNRIELRFNELSSQVKELELSLAHMETKLLTKDLKDKQAYGLLHYKLHEVKHRKLDEEIKELEAVLHLKNGTSKDQ
jgi:hypothetical protein